MIGVARDPAFALIGRHDVFQQVRALHELVSLRIALILRRVFERGALRRGKRQQNVDHVTVTLFGRGKERRVVLKAVERAFKRRRIGFIVLALIFIFVFKIRTDLRLRDLLFRFFLEQLGELGEQDRFVLRTKFHLEIGNIFVEQHASAFVFDNGIFALVQKIVFAQARKEAVKRVFARRDRRAFERFIRSAIRCGVEPDINPVTAVVIFAVRRIHPCGQRARRTRRRTVGA